MKKKMNLEIKSEEKDENKNQNDILFELKSKQELEHINANCYNEADQIMFFMTKSIKINDYSYFWYNIS